MMTSRHADAKQYISAFRDNLLSPSGGLFISSPFEAGGGAYLRGGVINFETTMVSVLLEELEYKVEKRKYKTF